MTENVVFYRKIRICWNLKQKRAVFQDIFGNDSANFKNRKDIPPFTNKENHGKID